MSAPKAPSAVHEAERIDGLLRQALSLHQSGRGALAEPLYREILALDPRHADALNLLGLHLHQSGRSPDGARLVQEAVACNPRVPGYLINLGAIRRALGQTQEALAAYDQALALDPDSFIALYNSGAALMDLGRLGEAETRYRHALALMQDNMGLRVNLALALEGLERQGEAEDVLRQGLALTPGHALALSNLGGLLRARGALAEAEACFAEAARLCPDNALAQVNWAASLGDAGRAGEGLVAAERAVGMDPACAGAQRVRGDLLESLGRAGEAVQAYTEALTLDPNDAEAWNNLGLAQKEQGLLDEALASYAHAFAVRPSFTRAESHYQLMLHYMPGTTPATMGAAAKGWNARHAVSVERLVPRAVERSIRPAKLRLGYVSGDFRRHPVGGIIAAVLEAHDRERFELFCYSNTPAPDAMTRRIQASGVRWRNILPLSDYAAAKTIRDDAIDLLVDLSGHSANNRLLVFARKPAPVQAMWLGYFNTTGLAAMDYVLADARVCPPEADAFYVEKIARLPHAFLCFPRPEFDLQPGPPPYLQTGAVTFVCCNDPAKINAEVTALWARILAALPKSRLLLKWSSFRDPSVVDRYRARFAAHGIAPARVECRGPSDYLAYLQSYAEADIALDPFPYNGGATTTEALWMGLPVVALKGETFAGRFGFSILSSVGRPEWAAATPEDYVAIALALARDPARLAALRHALRQELLASPLYDVPHFTRGLERTYDQMWLGKA